MASTKQGSGTARGSDGPVRRLVIVESPAKARTISNYLGEGYVVESSRGHIRDLPRGAADVPAKYKGEKWARLGVNVDNGFEPLYVVSPDKKSTVSELKSLLKDVDELYLATDGDREGEAIAWHLLQALKPKVPVKRMVFHEITKPAILEAAENPRELDDDLVDAQETRRILDRLYGYEVSPVLWKKVMPKLSAGRVQSVATRVIVQRERERMAFTAADYWDIAATLDAGAEASPRSFGAKLASIDGKRVATGRDFGQDGRLKDGSKTQGKQDVVLVDEAYAHALTESLRGADLTVSSAEEKPYTRRPYAPFMTSTLQQEAGRKLKFSAERTMRVAQKLYENGHITYMRTDSTTLSESATRAAREQAGELYGPEYVHSSPRQYNRKVKNAQEAHEAIRPAGDSFKTPGQLHSRLDGDGFRLYELIWQRTVASQMADARGLTLSLRIGGTARTGEECVLSASGRTITFPGFLKAYVETVDAQAGGEADDAERRLPYVSEGTAVTATELTPEAHSTTAPSRYTEASLVKRLEDLGIGRPSTYASIIKTILDRGYVYKRGSALVPAWVAFAVIGLLEAHFSRLVDFDFTATMENELDEIAAGNQSRVDWLTDFYFGDTHAPAETLSGSGGLKQLVGGNLEGIDARSINSIHVFDDSQGRAVYVRVGRYGPYLERTVVGEDGEEKSQRANLTDSISPDELTLEVAEKLFATPQEGRELGVDPATGHRILAKEGRFGPYVTEVLPEPDEDSAGASSGAAGAASAGSGDSGNAAADSATKAPAKKTAKKSAKSKGPKPRTASLLKSMELSTITLDDALSLLSLPRVVGTDPESGEEITAQNGRYGPYMKKGSDSRSLETEDQIFTITLDEALKIYAQPKRRGRQAAKPPLRELGNDPSTDKPVVVKDGRFGPYVTDGETNASLRTGDTVEEVTVDRASELLELRRAKGGETKAGAKKTATKKTETQKGATKKAATQKAAASKTAGKKSTTQKAATTKSATTKSAGKKSAADDDAAATKSSN